MTTEQDIIDQREQAQNDIRCVLDGFEEKTIDNVCQVVIERFNNLLE